MEKYDINKWVFEIPLQDIQEEYSELSESSNEQCICCGKKIKNVKYWVHLLTNGNLVSTNEPFSDSEDMGFFPIGTKCKLKLPNNFYFKD